MTPPNDTAKADAVAWLVGRLRFERLLSELQHHVEETGEPVDLDAVAPAPAPARAA